MRYEIKNRTVVESIFIDAPYDTKADAMLAVNEGVFEYTKSMDSPIYLCHYCNTQLDNADNECLECAIEISANGHLSGF